MVATLILLLLVIVMVLYILYYGYDVYTHRDELEAETSCVKAG